MFLLLSRSDSRIANGSCRPGFPLRNCLPPYGGWFWSFFSHFPEWIVILFCGPFCHKGFFRFHFSFSLVGILLISTWILWISLLDSGCSKISLSSSLVPCPNFAKFGSSRGAMFSLPPFWYFPVFGLANLLGACHRERNPVLLWILGP